MLNHHIDPPAASADENYRDKCFEDLLGCIGDLAPLAKKILDDGSLERGAVDATMHIVIEMLQAIMENTVTTWREES